MISPILDSILPTETLLVYINPAILQSKYFSPSRALQLHSATRLKEQEHHSRTTCSPRKPDNFPNVCGFRWRCEIWVSHQRSPPSAAEERGHISILWLLEFRLRREPLHPQRRSELIAQHCHGKGEDTSQTPQNHQLVPEIEKTA